MPNRILKESICTSDTINQLSDATEAFFYRLLVQCDDHGRMDARASVLRARLYPLRLETITDGIVIQLLHECAAVGLLILYESAGRPYLIVKNWKNHQQVRANKSKFPEPPALVDHKKPLPEFEKLISSDINCNQLQSNVPENRESGIENRESNSNSDSEMGAGAPSSPPDDQKPDDSKPLTAGQKFFISEFGAKRFKTPSQRQAVLDLEIKWGTDRLKECITWAAKKGMSIGDAISSIETAIPTWGNKKNGAAHVRHAAIPTSKTQPAASTPLARKIAGRKD